MKKIRRGDKKRRRNTPSRIFKEYIKLINDIAELEKLKEHLREELLHVVIAEGAREVDGYLFEERVRTSWTMPKNIRDMEALLKAKKSVATKTGKAKAETISYLYVGGAVSNEDNEE